MASLVDSTRTIINGSHPFLKVFGLSFGIFAVLQIILSNATEPQTKMIIAIITILILFGYYIQAIHNSINDKAILIPRPYNLLYFLFNGLRGVISLLPYIALVYYGMLWINPLMTFDTWINITLQILAFTLLFSFFATGLLLHARNFSFIQSYDFKKLIKYSGDIVVRNYTLLFGLAVLIGLIFVPVGIGIHLMFDYGPVFNFYVIFSAVFLLLIVSQYYALLYFEYMDLD